MQRNLWLHWKQQVSFTNTLSFLIRASAIHDDPHCGRVRATVRVGGVGIARAILVRLEYGECWSVQIDRPASTEEVGTGGPVVAVAVAPLTSAQGQHLEVERRSKKQWARYLASSGLYCNQTTEVNTLEAISPSVHPQQHQQR